MLETPSSTIRRRLHAGRAGWTGPLVMTFLMAVLASLTSLGLTAYFVATGHPEPGGATGSLVNVWNTLLYVPMLVALTYFVRKEGLRISDLIGFDRSRLRRDVLIGVSLAFLLFILDALLEFGVSRAIYTVFGNPFAGLTFADFPEPSALAVVFGLIFLPLGAGITEELVYRGYALPRLSALSNRGMGLLIMGVGFCLQHVGLALAGDWRFVLERGVVLAIVGIIMGAIYLKQKRLLPLIVGHVVWDFLGIGVLGGLLPLLMHP